MVLAKADKGDAIVILTSKQYNEKMLSFLQSSNATRTTFGLKRHNDEVKAAIKNTSFLFGSDMHDKLIQMVSSLPQLYGQIKVHKPEAPIRPVVASITAPTYRLAKFLAQWFRSVTGFVGTYSIKNSIELVSKLNQTKFPEGSILVSFDVQSMYTCISVQLSIKLMITLLQQKNIPADIINEFRKLVHCAS